MHDDDFFEERGSTRIGTMLLVTDARESLRALDWEDHEDRMHRLLGRHYGAGTVRLIARPEASPATREYLVD